MLSRLNFTIPLCLKKIKEKKTFPSAQQAERENFYAGS
jgi:hypothetical protein